MPELSFELPRDSTRIWDIPVPIVKDVKNNTVSVYITGTIDEPCYYNELCYMLQTADEDAVIDLYINTPGGIIDSAFMVANAIAKSSARVIGHLSGTVASAGTIISMACSELDVTEHLSFMVHNYSGGVQGKGHEMKARQKFTDEHLSAAFKYFYEGFLSEEEMQKVMEGADMWMGTEEVIERWNQRVDYTAGKA
jgi:ATP-dependent protease ClpP protease subunit